MKEQVHTPVSTNAMPLYKLLADLPPRSSIETVWRVAAHGREVPSTDGWDASPGGSQEADPPAWSTAPFANHTIVCTVICG